MKGPEIFQVNGHGGLSGSITDLFGPLPSVSDAFVRAEVTRSEGIIGFEMIELEDTVLGLNAFESGTVNTLYSAQLASGGDSGKQGSFFTNVKLVNTGDKKAHVVLTVFLDHRKVPLTIEVKFNPLESFQSNISEMFSLASTSVYPAVGSIQIESDEIGVIGDVIFGDPVRLDYAASLPLQSYLMRRAVFRQVANGVTSAGDSSRDIFTGIAVFNPSNVSIEVTVKVFNSKGEPQGETFLTLEPKARISGLIENLIPQSASLIGGYVVLESTEGVVAQQLFGNSSLTFLSAVPPTAYR